MKLKYFLEEFSDYAKNDAEEFFSVFKNPSLRDYGEIEQENRKALKNMLKDKEQINKLSKEFRFLIDDLKKEVYAFSAMLLHQDAIKAVMKNPHFLRRGRGTIKDGKFLVRNVVEIPDWAKGYLGQ